MIQLLIPFLFFILACTTTPAKEKYNESTATTQSKTLIVYVSRTNNTKAVAEMIHEHTGGKLVALKLKKPYPEDYKKMVEQVAEENNSGYLPPLETSIDGMAHYDTVFVGFPTWGMKLPPPIKSFLHQYNLSGKTVIPFNTNAGYGIGSSFETVKELCPESHVLKGFTTKGGIERDGVYLAIEGDRKKDVAKEVKEWLIKIEVINKGF